MTAPDTSDPTSADAPPFEPHAFFWGPWWGTGEVRTAGGGLVAKYRVSGEGRSNDDKGLVSQKIVFDNGLEHVTSWEILSTDPTNYQARDQTGVVATGRRQGDAFVWSFKSKVQTPFGRRSVTSTVTYTMATPTTATSVCINRMWGIVPLSTLTTYYSQVR